MSCLPRVKNWSFIAYALSTCITPTYKILRRTFFSVSTTAEKLMQHGPRWRPSVGHFVAWSSHSVVLFCNYVLTLVLFPPLTRTANLFCRDGTGARHGRARRAWYGRTRHAAEAWVGRGSGDGNGRPGHGHGRNGYEPRCVLTDYCLLMEGWSVRRSLL